MKILNITINEYASIKGKSIDFSDGLNIIEGENESGKSSILSFIKFILYGFPKKSAGDTVSEKERGLSWSGGIADGSMTVRTKSGDFRIERTARSARGSDSVRIIDISTGSPVFPGEVPGEVFLGVSSRVFESSACVRQLECSSIDGGELGGAIENLLLSADETMSTQKALGKIERIRKKLLYRSGKGGSIYELELEREALSARLKNATERSKRIAEYEFGYGDLSALCSRLRAELEEKNSLLAAYDARSKQIKLDGLRSARARIETIKSEAESKKAENRIDGFLPDGAYLRELSLAEAEYFSAAEAVGEKSEKLKSASVPMTGESLIKAKNAQAIVLAGGEKEASSIYRSKKKKEHALRGFGVTALILCALAMAILALRLLPVTIPLLGTLVGVTDAMIIFASASVFFLVLTIFSFIGAAKERKSADTLRRMLGFPEEADDSELYAFLCECMAADRKKTELEGAKEQAEKALGASKEKLLASRNELARLLHLSGEDIPSDADADDIKLACERAAEKTEKLIAELAEYDRDLGKYAALCEEREKDIADIDERQISELLTPDAIEKLSTVNITMLRRDVDYLTHQLEAAENKKYRYDRELIGLRASSDDPFKIRSKIDLIDLRLSRERALHRALTLAESAIENASESMHKNITPRLHAGASELMSELTHGKYSDLGISKDFSLTVCADGVTRPIEALSSGTKDASYLSVRLALVGVLYTDEKPPILLDEVLSQIDDKRAEAILKMLVKYCERDSQCLLFSCHTREERLIDANVIKIG